VKELIRCFSGQCLKQGGKGRGHLPGKGPQGETKYTKGEVYLGQINCTVLRTVQLENKAHPKFFGQESPVCCGGLWVKAVFIGRWRMR
jgi:hypothetical protein